MLLSDFVRNVSETLETFFGRVQVEQIKKRKFVSELILFQAAFLFLWIGKAIDSFISFHFFHSLQLFSLVC